MTARGTNWLIKEDQYVSIVELSVVTNTSGWTSSDKMKKFDYF